MSYRPWLLAFAVGLAVATLGQAQEQAETADSDPAEEQSPAQTLPVPLPVLVIEDDERAASRHRREEVADQREEDNLLAQQAISAATQSMDEANQRMARYSAISAGLVALGTMLLLWTLYLTRQANKAAQDAVTVTQRIGEAQVRAYLSVVPLGVKEITVGGWAEIKFKIINTGQSPAYHVRYEATVCPGGYTRKQADPFPHELGSAQFTGGITIPAQSDAPACAKTFGPLTKKT
jgi:hypothetical protein